MLEGAGIYLQHSDLWGAGGAQSTSARSPPFPGDPALPMLIATRQKHPQKFPMSLSVQDLEYIAISLCIIVQKSICRVILDHGETQERQRSEQSR